MYRSEKHTESETYKAARALFDCIPQNWYEHLIWYERGDSLHPVMQDAMLETWDDVVHRVELKTIDREELFDAYKSSDESARLLAEKIHQERENADLKKLRFFRYGLIITIHASEVLKREQPEDK